jgi:hypothetical protein
MGKKYGKKAPAKKYGSKVKHVGTVKTFDT